MWTCPKVTSCEIKTWQFFDFCDSHPEPASHLRGATMISKIRFFLPLELWIRKLILGCFFCILPRRHYMNCCLPWPPEGQARNASHAWSLWSSLMQPSTCCPSQMCHVSGPSSIFLYAVLNILGITPFLHSSTKRCLPLVQRGSSFQCFLLTVLCSG